MATTFEEHVEAKSGLTVGGTTLVLPVGQLTDSNWSSSSSARLASSKAVHTQIESIELAVQDVAVAASETLLFIANGAGTFNKLEAVVITAATGADRTVNIDLQKSTAGGSFSTVLTATLEFDNVDVALTPTTATFTTDTYLASDIFKIIVTVAGAAGNQAIGCVVSVTKSENPS